MSLFKINATKSYTKLTRISNVYGGGNKLRKPKMKKQSVDSIVKAVRILFRLKKENKAIQDRIIRDIRNFLSKEKKIITNDRSSHKRFSVQKGVIRNFTKFTGKHLCQCLFFNKVAGLRPATLLKKRHWHRCFPVNFVKLLRTIFLQNTSG